MPVSKLFSTWSFPLRGMCGLVLFTVLFSSCSNTKYLRKNQTLLTGNKINVKGELQVAERDQIRSSLSSPSIELQQPNYKTAHLMRLKLWLYNQKYNEKKSSKFWNIVLVPKNIEPPVVYDSAKTAGTVENMQNYLHNQGFFYAGVSAAAKSKSRKTTVAYQVNTGKNFVISHIGYDITDSTIRHVVEGDSIHSVLQRNMPYRDETIIAERDRLTMLIRNAGYYKFSNNYIFMVVDTVNKALFRSFVNPFENIANLFDADREQEKPTLDITIRIVNPTDSTEHHRYSIANIYIYPDYTIDGAPDDSTFRKNPRKNFTILYHQALFKTTVLARALFFKKGALYSLNDYNNTINGFNQLNVWKFVTVQLDTVPGKPDSLDCYIFLIPNKKRELGADLEGTTSTDYILGGAVNLTYLNRNFARAANLLSLSLKSGIEWTGDSSRPFYVQAKEFSGQGSISFPRFITPWKIHNVSKFSNARTNLELGLSYLDRYNLFRMQSYRGAFGYDWNETQHKRWIIKPLVYEYNRIYAVSDSFQKILDQNPILASSLNSTFTGGENISFIYNNQDILHQKKNNYFRVNLDESGLLLSSINGLLKGASGGKTDFAKLTSLNYSQYIKLDLEYKHYYNRVHSTLVSRIYTGVGLPVGLSTVLPYIKQFTAGGPNSMRAWRLRSLGPGDYYDPSANPSNSFVNQTGDMKLEGNLEFRFDILKLFGGLIFLRGALFTDAGNIWNIHKDPLRPGTNFDISRFYQDIAVGSGAGLRLDLSYFLIRLDVATPLKQPYLPDNYGWVINKIDLLNGYWRKNNLILNFAIGYPF